MAKFVDLRLDKRVQEALAAFQIWSFCCFKSHLKGNRQPLFNFLESALSTALVWYAGSGQLFLCFSSPTVDALPPPQSGRGIGKLGPAPTSSSAAPPLQDGARPAA